jgi:hypothetical protein
VEGELSRIPVLPVPTATNIANTTLIFGIKAYQRGRKIHQKLISTFTEERRKELPPIGEEGGF